MSDPRSPIASRTFLAPLALAALFGCGLLLAYAVSPPPREEAPAPRPASRTDPRSTPGAEDARLTEARQRLQELEQAIAVLKAEQASALNKAREEAVAALERPHREALERAERSIRESRSSAKQLSRDYAALGACYTEHGLLVTLGEPDLRFAPGQGSLPNPPPQALDRVAELLQRNPDLRAQVEGYTDNQGSAAKNLTVSARRAESVRQALLGRGVQPERVQADGMGAANPVATNGSEAGRSRNRRVEIRLRESPTGSDSLSP